MLAAARAPRLGRRAVVRLARCVGRSVGSAGLRALVVLSDASCVGRESLHACCEFAGIDALLVKKMAVGMNFGCWYYGAPLKFMWGSIVEENARFAGWDY